MLGMFKLDWNEGTRCAYSRVLVRTERSAGGSRRKVWRFYSWRILDHGRSFGLHLDGMLLSKSGSVQLLMQAGSQVAVVAGHVPCTYEAWFAWNRNLRPDEKNRKPGDMFT